MKDDQFRPGDLVHVSRRWFADDHTITIGKQSNVYLVLRSQCERDAFAYDVLVVKSNIYKQGKVVCVYLEHAELF